MPIDETLERIEREIASDDLGKARDRLHGLIATYPYNLSLRQRLGDVYWALHHPAMAGRYWYLVEDKSAQMTAACDAFERSCGNSLLQILLALKFRGNPECLADEYAARRLLDLQAEVQDEYNYFIDFQRQGADRFEWVPGRRLSTRLAEAGCVALVLVAMALLLVGLYTVLAWIL